MTTTTMKHVGRAAVLSAFVGALGVSCTNGSQQEPKTAANSRGPSDTANGPGHQGGSTPAAAEANATMTPRSSAAAAFGPPAQSNEESNGATPSGAEPRNNSAAMFGTYSAPTATSNAAEAPNVPESANAAGNAAGRSIDNKAAIHEMASARCERLAACNRVGRDRRYETVTDCVVEQDRASNDDFGPKECREGINRDELSACVATLRTEKCTSAFGSIAQMDSCHSSELCAGP